MKSCIYLSIFVCLAVLVFVGFAQEAETPAVPTSDANVPSFPYIAEITGDDVYIRSGPGTDYYTCGKLNKADRVKVVDSRFSWSCIVPPAGRFSWISMQYVSIDKNDSTVGVVTGDNVRVWAGSANIKPIHSTRLQLRLNRDEKVRLLGEEKDDYYKITPPSGAYLWVSTRYTKPLGSADEVPLITESRTETKADTPAVVPTKVSVESEKLKEYYALEEQAESERAKPIAEQSYGDIRKKLFEIAGNKEAGKAARYSEFAIKQIERYELALEVDKAVQLQNEQLQRVKDRIDKARAARLAQVQDLGRFAAVGQFQTSKIYGTEVQLKHYRIIDNSGKTICYALPSSPAVRMDLSELIGCKVGLVGTIEPHPQTAGALVRFIEITKLE